MSDFEELIGKELKFDVVMQATAHHAHAVSQGIINSLKNLNLLNRVFHPKANWGDMIPIEDDGLYQYLAKPSSHFIIFLGADWHSQSLHHSNEWKLRIRTSPIIKILYSHETLSNGSKIEKDLKEYNFISAANLFDIVWHSSKAEENFIKEIFKKRKINKIITSSNFTVDTTLFNPGESIEKRIKFAFFRGKSASFNDLNQYKERREIIKLLKDIKEVDIKDYEPESFDNLNLSEEYKKYKICIDLPSVFLGPTTRVYEALASGCITYSKASNFTEEEKILFEPFLRTFNDGEDLIYKLKKDLNSQLSIDEYSKKIKFILEKVSLENDIKLQIKEWLKNIQNIYLTAPFIRIYDHPYHKITTSESIILDHFYSKYNVVTIYSDNKIIRETADKDFQKPYPYEIIFWQSQFHEQKSILDKKVSKNINIKVFPMLDASFHRGIEEFPSNVKYFCFSERLAEKLKKFELKVETLKYFPEIKKDKTSILEDIERTKQRQENQSLKAYFWHRNDFLSLKKVIKMSLQLNIKEIVIKDFPDTGIAKYSDKEINQFSSEIKITKDKWYKSKNEYLRNLENFDVYFAPRACEGIGLSFLEAMSNSICIIAYNAPTMNEYIKDNENGILFKEHEKINPLEGKHYDIYKIRKNLMNKIFDLSSKWINERDLIFKSIDPLSSERILKDFIKMGVKFRKFRNIQIER